MNRLSNAEYESFVAALRGELYERRLFEIACRKLRTGTGVRPEGVFLDRDIPQTMREWRKDQQWALNFVERHQKACNAAWREFWRVMTSNSPHNTHEEIVT